jgi:hypothetical protein
MSYHIPNPGPWSSWTYVLRDGKWRQKEVQVNFTPPSKYVLCDGCKNAQSAEGWLELEPNDLYASFNISNGSVGHDAELCMSCPHITPPGRKLRQRFFRHCPCEFDPAWKRSGVACQSPLVQIVGERAWDSRRTERRRSRQPINKPTSMDSKHTE